MSVSLGTVTSFNVGAGVGNTSYTAGSESVLAVLCGVEGSGLSGATCLGAGTATLQNYTSGGGYCGTLLFTIPNPTSGTLSVNFGSGANGIALLIPLIGASTSTPFGSVAGGAQSPTNSPSSGSITGVDNTGIYLGFVNSTYATNTVTSEASGWTGVFSGSASTGWFHLASFVSATTPQIYKPTLSFGGSNNAAIGVYANAASANSFPISIIPPYRRSFLGR